jgi:hypothetical protein
MPDLGVPTFTPSVGAGNAGLIRGAYEDFARGDMDAVLALFADDILWHVPGRGPLSRDYRGRSEVLGFFEQFTKLSGGSFQIELHDVLAKGDTVVALVTESAQRGGRTWSSPQVHVWTIRGGRIECFWQYQGDQQTEDEFWSMAA